MGVVSGAYGGVCEVFSGAYGGCMGVFSGAYGGCRGVFSEHFPDAPQVLRECFFRLSSAHLCSPDRPLSAAWSSEQKGMSGHSFHILTYNLPEAKNEGKKKKK